MVPASMVDLAPSRLGGKAQRRAALAVLAASACVLLVASGTWSKGMMLGEEGGSGVVGRGAAELESVSARAKAGALARVSGVQMVKDVKKVLQDVEATLQARALRKRAGNGRARPESADVKRNLNDVDHIMDGLEALVHESGSGSTRSPSNSIMSSMSSSSAESVAVSSGPSTVTVNGSTKTKHRVRGRNAAEAALDSMPGGAVKHKGKRKLDAKQLAIAAKMKALTDQISKDFKKVTGYGKQAGYVPPPKIPHV